MIVSMSRWSHLKMLASLLRCSNFFLLSFFPSFFCAPLANPLAPRRPLSYVYSSGNQLLLAPWCPKCVRSDPVRRLCGVRKHACDVLGPNSDRRDPALDVVKVVDRNMWCCGSFPLGFVHLLPAIAQAPDPPDADC